ncbi:MAG TPA: Mut7-C ubiquitin/RNAse domain-containing protein [Candidatus Hydrogenedentes bacterium]|nr:Mut7-C ubiquitin/RNAse domain-containing protein [Candidatus Hydrogenedentota bacterium]
MYAILIRFYEELNDFLPEEMRKRDVEWNFENRRSVKDLIESFGVPHTEVDLILVNGVSVDFSYLVQDGDRISVYPVFETFAIADATRLRPEPLRDPRFVCDVHLGKLARRLRLLGFDVLLAEELDDGELVDLAEMAKRILLTRDRGLLMRKRLTRGILIRHTEAAEQAEEILDRLDLRKTCAPFTRCTACNGLLQTVNKGEDGFAEIRDKIPEKVLGWRQEYSVCTSCGKVYWKGSHYEKLAEMVERFVAGGGRSLSDSATRNVT